MAELTFKTLDNNLISPFKDEKFSVMYFGLHFGKGLLILQHSITILAVFNDENWYKCSFFKTVSFRGDSVIGGQISGIGDCVLLLDELGNLWRLTNSCEKFESLNEDSFYVWIPFKKLNFTKVLALTTMRDGFIFLGMTNFDKKLICLSSINSNTEEFHFSELKAIKSFDFYLTNLNIDVRHSVFKHYLDSDEVLLLCDKLSGKIYLCSKNGRHYLLTHSNIFLVSVIHFQTDHTVLFCFENGKMLLLFYKKSADLCAVYTHKKILAVEKCFCSDSCLLWSDGVTMQHTKILLNESITLCHLQIRGNVEIPIALLKIPQSILIVTINNIYYLVEIGSSLGVEIKKQPKELFLKLHKNCELVGKLESEINNISYYLYCKDLVEKSVKFDLKRENNYLLLKSLGINLRKDFWKFKLKKLEHRKKAVEFVSLEHDLNEGMLMKIRISFNEKVEVSLVGDFDKRILYSKLGVV